MNLSQDILRLLTIKALQGRTWADDRVFDSPSQPADLKIEQDRAAFISCYTDEADVDLDGQSFHNADAKVYLLIECAAADRMTVPALPDGTSQSQPPAAETVTTLAQTDQALELIIGCLARQAIQALLATDNIWSELWRLFTTPGRSRVEVRRGGPGQEGQQSAIRYASRIMRMQVSVLADPVYGEGIGEPKRHDHKNGHDNGDDDDDDAPEHDHRHNRRRHQPGFWERFFEAAEADVEQPDDTPLIRQTRLAGIVPILRAHFETNPPLVSWRIEQKRGTYTFEALRSLGITPAPENIRFRHDDSEPPLAVGMGSLP